ncbi:MAG: LOG family protein [Bacteroidota bacterium]
MNRKFIISIFGSSRPAEDTAQYTIAYEIGRALAKAGYIVCNGGYGGTMQASACGAKEAGGETIGIVTQYFSRIPNKWIDTVIEVPTMIDRLMELVKRADGYVVLEGGTGTLLEFAYVWELINKGVIQQKPIVVVGNFWDRVVETLKTELIFEGLEDCARHVTRVISAEECVNVLDRALKSAV